MMVSSAMNAALVWLVLVLAAAAQARVLRVLRERQQRVCSSAHFGSSSGASAQRLVVTHLTPGVADWNIAVPMPPKCKNARVTGVETSVCDADEPPDVSMHDLVSARVHRRGTISTYATVDVTVYCVLPPSTPSPATTASSALGAYGAAGLQYGDARSSYEVLSNELLSNEVVSGEVASGEIASDGFTSTELVLKVVTPIPSVVTVPPVPVTPAPVPPAPPVTVPPAPPVTVPPVPVPPVTVPPVPEPSVPVPETSTPHIQLASLVQSVDPPVPKEKPQSNDLQPKSYEVTIKLRPPSYDQNHDKGQTLTYEARLPALPLEDEKQVIEIDPVPEIPTPPRNVPTISQPPVAVAPTSGATELQPGSLYTGTNLPPPESRGLVPGAPTAQPGMFLPQPRPLGGPASGMRYPPPQPGSLMLPPQYPPLYDAIPPAIVVAPVIRPLRFLNSRFGVWPRQRSILLFPRL